VDRRDVLTGAVHIGRQSGCHLAAALVVGWDAARQQYRVILNDNYGHADVMSGHTDGRHLR
jgi:hypothetical protein